MQLKDNVVDSLSVQVETGHTSITLNDATNFEDPDDFGQYWVRIKDIADSTSERMRVTSKTGNTLSVTRGEIGETAQQHVSGSSVSVVAGAPDIESANRLNVRSFGAVGDGSTDDTAAINAAITAANRAAATLEARGADVIFPYTKTGYKVTDTITLQEGVQLLGLGKRTRLLFDATTNPNNTFIDMVGGRSAIKNLLLEGTTSPAFNGYMIDMDSISYVLIEDCEFKNTTKSPAALNMLSVGKVTLYNLKFKGISYENIRGDGITKLVISECDCSVPAGATSGTIHLINTGPSAIKDCWFLFNDSGVIGINLEGGRGNIVKNCEFVFSATGGTGIKIASVSTGHALVSSCSFIGSGNAGQVTGVEVVYGEDCNISKCIFRQSSGGGSVRSVYLSESTVLNTMMIGCSHIGDSSPDISAAVRQLRPVEFRPIESYTIASGAITGLPITGPIYRASVVPESGSTDTLTDIDPIADGAILILRVNNDVNTITVADGTGNIQLAGSDATLENVRDTLTLVYEASLNEYYEIARSTN